MACISASGHCCRVWSQESNMAVGIRQHRSVGCIHLYCGYDIVEGKRGVKMWPIVIITLAGAAFIGFLGFESARSVRDRAAMRRQSLPSAAKSQTPDRGQTGRNGDNPEAMKMAEAGRIGGQLELTHSGK